MSSISHFLFLDAGKDNGTTQLESMQQLQLNSNSVPQVVEAHHALIYAEMQAGNMKGVMKAVKTGLKLHPENGQMNALFCRNAGQVLSNHLDYAKIKLPHYSEIIPYCYKAAEMLPDDPNAQADLAFVLKTTMRYKEAVVAYDSWLERFGELNHADFIITKTNKARALMRDGQFDAAHQVLLEILDDPEGRTSSNMQAASMNRAIGYPMDPLAWEYKQESLEMTVSEFTMTGGKGSPLCNPGGKWRLAYNYSEEAVAHPDRVQVTHLNPDTVYQSYGTPTDPKFVGFELPRYPKVYHEKSMFLVHLSDTYMSGHPGVLHSDCTLYTGSHHVNIDLQIFPGTDKHMEIVEINEPAVSIIQHQMSNYYHWVSEVLPKLLLLNDHILSKPGNEHVKIVIAAPAASSSVIRDTFNMPEFKHLKGRFIEYDDPGRKRYHFKKGLWIVDWIHPKVDLHGTWDKSVWGMYWPPRGAYDRVRKFWWDALKARNMFPAEGSDPENIVYVSRKGAVRGFPNEDILLDYLRDRFGTRFVVHTGKEDAMEQVRKFVDAKVVVGNHGAGLSGFLATTGNSRLVMVPADPHIDFCFGHMVAAVGGKHVVITEIPGANYFGTFGPITKKQMIIIGDAIQAALDEVDAEKAAQHDEL
ncbi:hypothetical protein HDU99_008002 [Rhizoclosmatium hyalinum]|nr:hypothetical protein HDU99_008002 [Rhizoclosmatium hyalinum]